MAKGDVKITLDVDGKPLELTKKQAKGLEKQLDKTGKSAASADRQLKGAARASSNTTKNFSKMSQGISGGLVPAYATLAASLFAAGAAFRFLQDAADLRVLLQGQQSAAMATGVAMNTLAKSLQRATANQITFQEASQAAAIGLAAGLNRDQLDDLAEGANIVSKILGRNVPDSFNRLIRGATKAEPELLDELGIVLRLADATKEYGNMIGVNAEKLTSYQRTQAVTLDITKQIDERFGALNELVGDNENQFNQLAVTLDELVNKLKIFSAAVGEPVARFLNDNILAAASAMGIFAASIIRSVVPSYEEMKQKSIEAAKIQQAGFEATERKIQAADRALERYNRKLEKAGKSSKALAGQAGAMPGEFAKGKPGSIAALEAGGVGGLSRQQKAGLTKAFKAVDKELLDNSTKTIQNRNSMFYGMEKKKVLMYKNSFTQMDNISMTSAQKNKILLKKRGLEWQKFTTSIQLRWQGAMAAMSRATNAFGQVMAGIARFAGFIGMITLVISLGQQLFQMFKKTNEELEKFKNEVKDSIELNKSLSDEFLLMAERLAKIKFKDTKTALTFFGNAAKNINLEDFFSQLDRIKKGLGDNEKVLGKTYDDFLAGGGAKVLNFYDNFGIATGGYTKKQLEAAKALRDFGPEAQKQKESLLDMTRSYAKIDPQMAAYADLIESQNDLTDTQRELFEKRIKQNQSYVDAVNSQTAAEKTRSDAISRLNSNLLATDYQTLINSNRDIAKALEQQIDATNKLNIADKKENDARKERIRLLNKEANFWENLQKGIDATTLATKRLQGVATIASFDTSQQGQRVSASIGISQQELARQEAYSKFSASEQTLSKITDKTSDEYKNAKTNLDLAKEDVQIQHAKLELLRMQNDQYLMMGQNAKNAFEGATSSALKDFITGENGSFTEAITKIATSTLDSIASSLADMMTGGLMDALFGKKKPEDLIRDGMVEAANYHAKVIKAAVAGETIPGVPEIGGGEGGTPGLLSGFQSKIEGMFSGLFGNIGGFFSSMFGGFSSIFGLAKGGIIPMAKGGIKGYAAGGRVDEPTYLVGEGRNSEAVVPLPDNRSIPVKLNGAAGTNNVTVNVSGLGQGQTSTIADQERARAMGDAIAIAVQSELAKQMRPNGMLNKRR